jgi:serine/threonine protein kinase/Flp pilus assembly protein TadD
MSEETLFYEALARPASERAAFLDAACGGEPELRRRLDVLLQAHDQPGSFLHKPAAEGATSAASAGEGIDPATAPHLTEGPGTVLGPYKLLEQIGEGGMGTVWMAEQQEPIQRRVAVKVVKAGMDSRQVLARFEAERQALALMDHPHIAKVLDAGKAPSGRPYFVMELVKGQPITRYCDGVRLGVRQRLELFGDVCRAVQHAHQKGIIHRDIKPSNVLVAPYDGKPVVKVIDFGVAKATGQRLTDKTLFTGFGALVGTPEYMSPEQAEVNNQDIDTRSDVYSLGVLLYELLTGSTPLTRQRFQETPILEVLRVIREEEPPKPSTRLSEAKDTLPSIAAQRQTEPAKLTRLMRGELDWIAMKALEKDRNRRYETANGLAQDVQRYLADEPVQACPPSAGYRLRKFARRNKIQLLAASLVFLALILGVTGTTLGLRREAEQRAKAEKARDRTREALDLMTSAVTGGSLESQKEISPDQKKFLAEMLKYYREFAGEKADDETSRSRSAMAARNLGVIEARLNRLEEAVADFRMARDEYAKLTTDFPNEGNYPIHWGQCQYLLALTLRLSGMLAAAESEARMAVALHEKLAPEFSAVPDCRYYLALSHESLGRVLNVMGKKSEAEKQDRQAISTLEKLTADFPTNPEYRSHLADGHFYLGSVLRDTGQWDEAERAYHHAITILEELATESPTARDIRQHLANNYNDLGGLLSELGQRSAAEQFYHRAIEIQQKLADDYPSNPSYRKELATYYINQSTVLNGQGKTPAAVQALHRGREILEKLVADFPNAPEHRYLLAVSLTKQASLLEKLGQRPAAEEARRQAVVDAAKLADDFPTIAEYRHLAAETNENLGHMLHQQGRLPDAEKAYRTALSVYEKLEAEFSSAPWFSAGYAHTCVAYGTTLCVCGQLEASLDLFTKAITLLEPLVQREPRLTKERLCLRNAYDARARALFHLRRLEEAVADWSRAIELDPNYVDSLRGRRIAYAALEQYEKALEDYQTILKLAPADVLAHKGLAWLLAMCPEAKLRDPVRAVELARKAVQLAPKNGDCWSTLGMAHYRAGDWKAAVDAFDKSMELRAGRDAFEAFVLAMTHRKMGDPTEARNWYDGAVRWVENNAPALEKDPTLAKDLRRIRSEAEEVLELKKK